MMGKAGDLLKDPNRLARGIRRRVFPTRFERISSIPGWTNPDQLKYLMDNVRALPDGSLIVEIGVWMGRSALAMAEACRSTKKKVFAIDPWKDYMEDWRDRSNERSLISEHFDELGVRSFEESYQGFLRNCKRFSLSPWIVPCRATSLEAAKSWTEGPIGMLFVDGNHDYEEVLADLNAWVPLVGAGGLVCGDDWNWKTVKAAVQAFSKERSGVRIENPLSNMWTFRA